MAFFYYKKQCRIKLQEAFENLKQEDKKYALDVSYFKAVKASLSKIDTKEAAKII